MEGRQAIVQLDPDHPGFRDLEYRARRNLIAQIAMEYEPGTPVPDAPYTEEEHGVWRAVWSSVEPAHQKYACAEYLRYGALLDLPRQEIPQLDEVSVRVQKLSGFRLEPVGGLVQPKVFLSTLGDGVFLSTQYIRHYSTPLYTPEPDVVHELIGHATMLASPKFAHLNRLIGAAAKRTESDEALERLGRVYWYTIEFGVLREEGHVKAYGAGLLSSAGELEAMSKADIRPFSLEEMQSLSYDVTQFQPVLFCADSFDEMYETLGQFFEGWSGR
ncbi:MAG: phenylalanine 4-monooxygenase [Myxococcales bacterium]|nr:phenylalanine 4-monooxygenase [Myxococcales bacterium]